jgi:arylsulfatase A-like enzyme
MYDGKSDQELAPSTFFDDPAKTKHGRQTWEHYYEAVAALDHEVGRVMDTIRNSSLSSNTLVVFMGDNGFMMGRRDMHGKYVPYEDSLRVPMIAWGPGVLGTQGTTVTAAVNSLDLPPTYVTLAGGTPPKDWTGRQFTDVLKDGQAHEFTAANSSYPDHNSLIEHVKAYRVIRTPEYKLILWHPGTGRVPELYNLQKDPAENHNLFNSLQPSESQAMLEKLITEYRQRTGDDQWDMKGPLGMFEPERLKWEYNEGPTSATEAAKANAPTKGKAVRKGKKRRK